MMCWCLWSSVSIYENVMLFKLCIFHNYVLIFIMWCFYKLWVTYMTIFQSIWLVVSSGIFMDAGYPFVLPVMGMRKTYSRALKSSPNLGWKCGPNEHKLSRGSWSLVLMFRPHEQWQTQSINLGWPVEDD
jgi:hypothetical protein